MMGKHGKIYARYKTLFDFNLRPLQLYLSHMIWEVAYIILAVDPSLGKTGAVIQFLSELFKEKPHYRVLVVAPLRVAQETWPEELALWYHARHLPYVVIEGTPEERSRLLRKDVFIQIINKENLQWMWRELSEGKHWDYDVLVIDEASMLKEGKKQTVTSREGKGSRPMSRFGLLCRARATTNIRYIVEMTGSPAPEGVHNLWGLSYLLDKGERLGRSKKAFEQRWFIKNEYSREIKPREGAEEEIMDLISDQMYSLREEDHLDIGTEVVTTPDTDIFVKMSDKHMAEYKRFERHLYSKEYDVEAVSSGVLINKLLQFANGSMYRSRDEDIHIHDYKAHALCDLVETLDGRPLIVAWSYRFDIARIRHFLGKKVTFIEDAGKNWKKDWDRGRIRVLATHPLSMAHGLNMQFGGAHACWYGLCHSGEAYTQFNKRLPRPGQLSDHVFLYHILTRGTADLGVLEDKQDKGDTEARIRDRVRIRKADIERELRNA